MCSLVHEFAPHEPEAVHPCRYRGPAAGRLAAVAHARLAARRYYTTRWLAGALGYPMQRLSALIRYVFTVILVPIIIAVATHFIEEQPRETSNAVLKFLFDLSEQTWFRVTASLLVGFAAGLWVDWFLRKLDGSRAKQREALGYEMCNLAHDLGSAHHPLMVNPMYANRSRMMSCFTTARKFGIWVPDDRIFSMLHPPRAVDLVVAYLDDVGTMLKDGHFKQAKQHAKNRRASFD